MDTRDDPAPWLTELPTPYEVLAPAVQTLPVVVASPHSCLLYTSDAADE